MGSGRQSKKHKLEALVDDLLMADPSHAKRIWQQNLHEDHGHVDEDGLTLWRGHVRQHLLLWRLSANPAALWAAAMATEAS